MAQSSTMEYEIEQKAKKRLYAKCDRIAVKIVTMVANRMDRDGVLEAYEGIEAAREIRELLIKSFK